ncbi:serine hydrolase [Flavobacteriaceae bacterium S0825]|uniref:serine hydrolase n=1 Tax=Gaetbulibacter sp. S0825 TaxID=2720084 RepID=UPI0014309362|nr:serine hydrolase [Gaetbulibacter sp. S0825]MCK0107903.1 serine hydrolase [Flavobacteriaceae bacterium S0825]NIX63539.1 serine hydrolase [Gaetbulibacter sp. S0825]
MNNKLQLTIPKVKHSIFLVLGCLNAILSVACQSNKTTTDESDLLSNRISNYLKQSETNGFSGAVLVAKNDSIIINKGFGFADKENNVFNNPNTVYDICSVSKQFTGAAIVKLAEDNKLKLESPISTFFDNLPEDKKGITIHQLLTHSAGFSHGSTDDFDLTSMDIYFSNLFQEKLLFTPGSEYSYSNSGYSILGRIIELVSGQDYETYLNEHLFQPSGMHQTGYLLPEWDSTTIANEYLLNVSNEGSYIAQYKKDGEIARTVLANGGIHSTNNDMYKWYQALKSNKILSQESFETLTKPYVAEYEDESSHYTYGWTVFTSKRNTKVITHNGFNGVSYNEFVWFPEEDVVILFASNAYIRPIRRMTMEIEKMLFDKAYVPEELPKYMVSELYKFTEAYKGSIDNLVKQLKLKFKNTIDSPRHLNRLGGTYYRKNKMEKAITIYKLNTQLFPEDGNSWDSLGDAYYKANVNDNAIKAYTKALELQPKNDDCFWCDNSSEKLSLLTKVNN